MMVVLQSITGNGHTWWLVSVARTNILLVFWLFYSAPFCRFCSCWGFVNCIWVLLVVLCMPLFEGFEDVNCIRVDSGG